MPVAEDPLLIPSSDPDDLGALRRELGGQTSALVPEVGLTRGVVTELHILAGLHGLHISRRRG